MVENETAGLPPQRRPEISVFWRPGCSSCLKVKEFLEETGLPFESVNIESRSGAQAEIMAAGLRGVPVVRMGSRYAYAQSLDDVASLIGVSRRHTRLSNRDLFDRWEPILQKTRLIVEKFSDQHLNAQVIPMRKRTVKELVVHVFQITCGFRRQIDEGEVDVKSIQSYVDPKIVTKADLLDYVDDTHRQLTEWLQSGAPGRIPDRIPTHYGEQDSGQVIERTVWHCAQHARQLDIVAAGRLGAELEIAPVFYVGLPVPKRLWA